MYRLPVHLHTSELAMRIILAVENAIEFSCYKNINVSNIRVEKYLRKKHTETTRHPLESIVSIEKFS